MNKETKDKIVKEYKKSPGSFSCHKCKVELKLTNTCSGCPIYVSSFNPD